MSVKFYYTTSDGEFNCQEYGGSEPQFKGKSRIDVWNSTITSVRKASESDLNLMLMRSTRKQQIKRNGVQITFRGEQLWYMHPEQTIMNLKHEVYVRYDPADLRTVRIYDAETERFMFEWQLADALMVDYLDDIQENIADGQERIKMSAKFIHEQAKGITANLSAEQRITMIDMSIKKARRNKDEKFRIQMPSNIIPIMAGEENINEKRAVGAESTGVVIDLVTMRENAAKRKG